MGLEADLLVDRRKLRNSLAFWRVATVLCVMATLFVIGGRAGGGLRAPYVARVAIDGIITDDEAKVGLIRALADNHAVAAVIVDIDSPGGSVAGGEALHDAIAAVAATKPVVAVMRGTAASAGYMVAAPAARIFARQSTITGSIGVLMETAEISGLLGKLGVSATQIVSGPLKGQPDMTQPLKPAARDYLQGMITDLFNQFVDIVAAGRHMDRARVLALADGRAYTGRQALPLGLIDAYGGEAEARAWLASARHVPRNLAVRSLERKRDWRGAFGAESVSMLMQSMQNLISSQQLSIDGPMALWHPEPR